MAYTRIETSRRRLVSAKGSSANALRWRRLGRGYKREEEVRERRVTYISRMAGRWNSSGGMVPVNLFREASLCDVHETVGNGCEAVSRDTYNVTNFLFAKSSLGSAPVSWLSPRSLIQLNG